MLRGLTVTNTDGKLVRLESGAWAQYRPVAVNGPVAVTILMAVELTEEEVRRLVPAVVESRSALH